MDNINLKVIFDDDVYVKEQIKGKDLEICGNHCILLKRNKVWNEESFLGGFTLTKYKSKIFDDNEIKQFSGYYSAWNLDLKIPDNRMNKILSFVVLNCTTNKSLS